MKTSILHQIYAKYEKNVKKKNYSFEDLLQIWCLLFFHWGYIFFFIHQKRFHGIENTILPLYEIGKKL